MKLTGVLRVVLCICFFCCVSISVLVAPTPKTSVSFFEEDIHISDAIYFPFNDNPKFAVFYNVYRANDTIWRRKTRYIIDEQLAQIRESGAGNSTIYYNRIGYREDDLKCPPDLTCQFMRHYSEAFEEVTLQSLHGYCLQNPNDRVVYLHNKGSFSKRYNQDHVRRIVTKSALSDKCLLSSRRGANVCGAIFQFQPFLHMSANMWTTNCSYAAKLIPPLEYEAKRRDLCRSYTVDIFNDTNFDFCPDKDHNPDGLGRESKYGFGRHAMERWIVSHPEMIPAEVFQKGMNMCRNGTCYWEPRITYPKRTLSQINRNIWRSFRFQMREYRFLYNESGGGFCSRFFRDLRPDPCSMNKFNTSEEWMKLGFRSYF